MTTSNLKYQNNKLFLIFVFVALVLVLAAYSYVAEKRQVYLSGMVKYHTKMIKLGNISSLVKLGKMYEKGEGVKKDLLKAQELFKKAINFNQYLDEIYPDYSKYDLGENSDEKIDYDNLVKINKNHKQLKNIVSSVVNSEKTDKKPIIDSAKKVVTKRKKITYVKVKQNSKKKSLLKNVHISKGNKIIPSRKTVALKNTSNSKLPKIKLRTKKYTQNKSTEEVNIKKPGQVSSIKLKSSKTDFKKITVLKKATIKKQQLQVKRSPTLYEERSDYETEPGIINDETLSDNDDDEIIAIQKKYLKSKPNINRNFASNPCATESARYIAKCRRVNRKK